MVNIKIKDMAPGGVFDIGPVKVKIMEHFADGKTLLTATEQIGNRPFTVRPFTFKRQDPEPNPNDFRFSSLKDDLNTDFLAAVAAGGVIPVDRILDAAWDLTASDGVNRYGYVTCKVAMLPEPLVRKYYDAGLLEIDDWEWTITPHAGSANYARNVSTGGSLTATAPGMATAASGRLSSWILKSVCRWKKTKSIWRTAFFCLNTLPGNLLKKSFAGSPPARRTRTKTNDHVRRLKGQGRRRSRGRPVSPLLRPG